MAISNGRPSQKQVDYALRLANELTGQRVCYVSQSSVLPRSIDTAVEACALIGDLKKAIEAEERRQAATGIVTGAKIRCTYARKDGTQGTLAGTITGFRWSGLAPAGVYLSDVEASWQVQGTWFGLDRMSGVRTGGDPESLRAERARLLARVAEIDAILAAASR